MMKIDERVVSLGVYPRIAARETTTFITIHQTHSHSHMNLHDDSSRCSLLGVCPSELFDVHASHTCRRVARETTTFITSRQIHSHSHMNLHYDSSLCSLLGVYRLCSLSNATAASVPRDGGLHLLSAAQETTRLITSHQIHRHSHVNLHYDSSLCSLLGVYRLSGSRLLIVTRQTSAHD